MSGAGGQGRLKVGMPPAASANARLFILGSLPGDASLAVRRYYAHPRNQFWRLLGAVLDEELQPLAYEGRLMRLAARRIGLWDVVGSAVRSGSLDQAIRQVGANPIAQLERDYPDLRAIAFNGGTAAALGRRLVSPGEGIRLIDLPSSSPANTRAFADKAAVWAQLRPFVG